MTAQGTTPGPLSAPGRPAVGLWTIAAVAVASWFLHATFIFSMPLAFGFVLAVLVRPVHRVLDERLPRPLKWLGLLAALLVLLAVLGLAAFLIYVVFDQVQEQLPRYAAELGHRWQALQAWASSYGVRLESGGGVGNIEAAILGAMKSIVPSFFESLGLIALIVFFALIMLVEAGRWEEKAHETLTSSVEVIQAIKLASVQVRRYLLVRTLIAMAEAIVEGGFLWLVGVDLWYLWTLLFFLLNYIPAIGSFLALFPPIIVAYLQMGFWWAAIVAAVLIALDQIIGNYIAPHIHGHIQNISALVMLATIMFWGWIWGVAGAMIAVPLTITLIMICSHIERLRPVALLLSREGEGPVPTVRP